VTKWLDEVHWDRDGLVPAAFSELHPRFRTPWVGILLFGVLAVVVGLALFDRPRAPTEVVAAQSGVASTRQRSDALQLPDARTLGKVRGELFGAPPPPPAPKASAPVVAPAPVAPPNPYRFAGKVVRGGEEVVLVSKGELVFPVKAGDTVDGTYKVESVGSDAIEFTYLPLGTRDRIAVASVLDVAPAPVAAAPAAATAVTPLPGTVPAGPPAPPTPRARRIPIAALALSIGFLIGLGVLFAWRKNHGAADENGNRS